MKPQELKKMINWKRIYFITISQFLKFVHTILQLFKYEAAFEAKMFSKLIFLR